MSNDTEILASLRATLRTALNGKTYGLSQAPVVLEDDGEPLEAVQRLYVYLHDGEDNHAATLVGGARRHSVLSVAVECYIPRATIKAREVLRTVLDDLRRAVPGAVFDPQRRVTNSTVVGRKIPSPDRGSQFYVGILDVEIAYQQDATP